jgi:hypothetical protein
VEDFFSTEYLGPHLQNVVLVVLKFVVFVTISCRVLWSLNTSLDDFDLTDYTKLISEEHFAVGHPFVMRCHTRNKAQVITQSFI